MNTESVDLTGGETGTVDEDSFVVDFSQVPDQGELPCLPRGVYDVEVDDLTFGMSQSSGNPMWTWKFAVDGGEHNGRKLFLHTPFAASIISRTKKIIGIFAPELLEKPFNPKEVAESGEMLGRKARARVDIRKWEGKNRNNVRDILPPAAGSSGGIADDFLG